MNYAALIASMKTYLQNTETVFVAEIPQLVRSAEQKIYRAIRPLSNRQTDATISFVDSTSTVDLSSVSPKVLLPLSLTIEVSSVSTTLLNKDMSFMKEAYPDGTTADEAKPRFYAFKDHQTLEVRPVPDITYTGTLTYFGFPTTIVTASTTWLGDNHETLLLYGCLIEGYVFMKGAADMLGVYKTRYDEELVLLKVELEATKTDEFYGDTVI